jgi:hypothetical protein
MFNYRRHENLRSAQYRITSGDTETMDPSEMSTLSRPMDSAPTMGQPSIFPQVGGLKEELSPADFAAARS